ncbi:MAG: DUF3858 domain-containing protein [Deltaproteobacteria bacterium]|nr:DUF3858 domain-containing protein [Deltaproteobacteria bacterium]
MTRMLPLVATLALLLPPVAHADDGPPIPPGVRAAPGADRYPLDDGLWVRRAVGWTLAPDGRLDRREERTLKVWTGHADRIGLLDPLLTWNDARARLEIDPVVTWRVDGTPVVAQANSFVPNTPGALESALPYASIQGTTVAFVGVEQGSTTRLSFEVRDRAASGVPAWGAVDLRSALPVLDQEVTVEVPAGTPLAWAVLDGTATVSASDAGGQRRLALRRQDVSALDTGEPHQGHDGIERLIWSTAADWTAVRRFLESRVTPAIVADDAVRAAADRVSGGTLSRDERIARIHDLVVDGVRTVDWPFADLDYAARPAPEVLASSVGHGLDKAVLLASLLRSAGEEAVVALAAPEPEIAGDVPCPLPFDRAWVRVGDDLWLDPTVRADAHNGTWLSGHALLVLDGSSGEPTAASVPPGGHRASLALDVTLVEDRGGLGVSGTADLDLALRYNPLAGFDRATDRATTVAEGLSGTLGGASTGPVTVATRSGGLTALRALFTDGHLDLPASGTIRLEAPRVPGAVTLASVQGWRQQRSLPLLLAAPATEEVRATWTLPDRWRAVFLPPAVEIHNRAGAFRRTVEHSEDRITLHAVLEIALPVVEPADWPLLRALLTAAEGANGSVVLVAREAP